MQQEPDASSFPNGGLRNTFEARGYTAWDPSSPALYYWWGVVYPDRFFVAYTGQALDYKAPLIKALQTLNDAVSSGCAILR